MYTNHRVHRQICTPSNRNGDCMPRGSASRSDTIVIGKPISSTRNIPARYPGCSEPGVH